MLDTAVGTVVGLRRCTIIAAFLELIGAARRHDIPMFVMASALVSLATGEGASPSSDTEGAAFNEWGQLMSTDIPSGV
ncbi:MAG: hypothetical protein NVS4B6_32310 [Mycobacterium sp.]